LTAVRRLWAPASGPGSRARDVTEPPQTAQASLRAGAAWGAMATPQRPAQASGSVPATSGPGAPPAARAAHADDRQNPPLAGFLAHGLLFRAGPGGARRPGGRLGRLGGRT